MRKTRKKHTIGYQTINTLLKAGYRKGEIAKRLKLPLPALSLFLKPENGWVFYDEKKKRYFPTMKYIEKRFGKFGEIDLVDDYETLCDIRDAIDDRLSILKKGHERILNEKA